MKFSPIIIGTMRWGVWGANHSIKKVQHLIETSLDENLYTFDHADIYGDYTTEKLFGEAFSEMKIDRDKIQLISKCGIQLPSSDRPFEVKSYNYSKEYILNSVDQSLQNLKTDYLDVLLLHRPSPLMNPSEIAESFEILRAQKKVKHFGVSNFSASQFEMINNTFPIITNQVEVSLNHTDGFYDGTLDQLMLKNIQPMAYSVLGNYFTHQSEENLRIKKELQNLCEKYNAGENQILLAFILKHPANILPIIGTSKAETIRELHKSLMLNLELDDWFKLLKAKNGNDVK